MQKVGNLGTLVPGYFWSKIRTFFRNQRFKEIQICIGPYGLYLLGNTVYNNSLRILSEVYN